MSRDRGGAFPGAAPRAPPAPARSHPPLPIHTYARARERKLTDETMTRPTPADDTLPPLTGPAPSADADPAAAYLASLTPGTGRTSMRATLNGVARAFGHPPHACPWGALRAHHIAALRARLTERGCAPNTINKTLTALRQIVRHAWLLDLVDDKTLRRVSEVRYVRARNLPAGRALDTAELAALLRACEDGTAAGARDAAAFALMAGCGLRRAEAVAVDVADYDPKSATLRVKGKGNRARVAFLATRTQGRLETWLAVRGSARGPLLAPVLKAGTVRAGVPLRGKAIGVRLGLRARAAGIVHCSPHDLRRTFISGALASGLDLAMVQSLAGHASPTTTVRYDRRPQADRAAAARRLDLP